MIATYPSGFLDNFYPVVIDSSNNNERVSIKIIPLMTRPAHILVGRAQGKLFLLIATKNKVKIQAIPPNNYRKQSENTNYSS